VTNPAVDVVDVSKRYRLYQERNQSLKASVMRGRRVRYKELWALQDVSLQVRPGTAFGLIGENGSGKSTLLKCMARILRPDRGSIATDGKVSALLELGAGFHPELSGRENVFLNGSILGLGKKQLLARFDEIVGFAGIEDFIDAPVKNYSSGMYVRLGFSVAINVDPDILLVDEVLAVGDAEFQRRCADKFAELRAQGKTIVIVTHALSTVKEMCDEAALLEHGRLQVVGNAVDVVDRYLGDVFASDGDAAADADTTPTISRVQLLDAAGNAIESACTGDSVTLRFDYALSGPYADPAITVSVHSLDGLEVSRPTARLTSVHGGVVPTEGTVDLRVDHLLLLPGTYDVVASVGEWGTPMRAPDRARGLRVVVARRDHIEEHGVVSLGGKWEFAGLEGSP
jgi:ABC-type polysaccharide/polyol phosphate transport system ATPase subunit